MAPWTGRVVWESGVGSAPETAGPDIAIDSHDFAQILKGVRRRGKREITAPWLNLIEAAGHRLVHGPIYDDDRKENGEPGLAVVEKSCTAGKISGFWPETTGYPLTVEETALVSRYISAMDGNDVELVVPLRNDRPPVRWFSFEESREYEIYRDHIYPVILDSLKKIPFRFLLDVGCGAGNLLMAIAGAHPGAALYGVDISPDSVVSAGEKGLAHVYNGDARRLTTLLPGPPSFDAIVFCGLLNRQVVDAGTARAVLRNALKLLNAGGYLMVTGYSSCHFGSNDFHRMGLRVVNRTLPANMFKNYDAFSLRQFYVARKEAPRQGNPFRESRDRAL